MAAAPFAPDAPVSVRSLPVLLAPLGRLSGDGQLRELIEERRAGKGADVELWYLEQALVEAFGLRLAPRKPPREASEAGQPDQRIEAMVAGDPAVITWLQLRFGGSIATFNLSPTLLHERAGELPPKAPPAAGGISSS